MALYFDENWNLKEGKDGEENTFITSPKDEIIIATTQEHTNNILNLRVEKTAKKIKEIFLRLKKETPLKKEIDIYKDPEWWKAITDLANWAWSEVSTLFDKNLQTELYNLWLKYPSPQLSYFTQKSTSPTVCFETGFLWPDTIREEALNNRAIKCAWVINKVFLRLKKETPLQTEIDIYKDHEWWKAITDLVDWARSDASLFFKKLQEKLYNLWLYFSSPSLSYFTEKSTSPTVWFKISFLWTDKLEKKN